jgi:hypothetical protein
VDRRQFLTLAAGAGVTAGLGACTGGGASAATDDVTPAPHLHLASRPDLTPPVLTSTTGADPAPVLGDLRVLLAPKDVGKGGTMQGLLVVDAGGQPVFVRNTEVGTFDFRRQEYRGAPVLTYWSGDSTSYGHGDVIILDERYDEIGRVTTGGGLGPHQADMHESYLSPEGTMLLLSYPLLRGDLTDVGGPSDGWMLDGVVQEVDVSTGGLLFEWRASDHVPLGDTYEELEPGEATRDEPFDPYHLNSIAPDGPEHLLVCARHTSAVYRVARSTGEVAWRLGGRRSSFRHDPGATFGWQHDARRQGDGTLTLFDNDTQGTSSRGLRLAVDPTAMTVAVVTEYRPPTTRLSATQGNVQVLDDGRVVVGWGSEPFVSVFTGDGELLLDWTFGKGTSYRAYAVPWTGDPVEGPVAVATATGGIPTVAASWNGATRVTGWRVRTGPSEAAARTVVTAPRDGFETRLHPLFLDSWTVVEALGADGSVLGASAL